MVGLLAPQRCENGQRRIHIVALWTDRLELAADRSAGLVLQQHFRPRLHSLSDDEDFWEPVLLERPSTRSISRADSG